MGRKRWGFFGACAVGLAVLFCFSVASAEMGVTDTEVRIGGIVDLSGPIAFMGKGVSGGADTYFKMINDQGGVNGRKIVYLVEDDSYSPPKAVAAAKKLIERDKVFSIFMVLGSAQALAMYPTLERAGVPLIQPATQNSSVSDPPKELLFHADPTYIVQAKIGMDYAMKELKMEKPKVAVLYQDDEPGQDWLKGVKASCEHYNLQLVAEVSYKRGTVDFSSQVVKMKEAGADLVMMWTLVREPAAILKEAMKLQWQPVWITATPSTADVVLKLSGDSAFYGKGFFGTAILAFPWEVNPAAAEFIKVWPKYNQRPWGFYDWYGWGCAKIMVEGLKRAGKDLTRKGLVKAFESFKDYQSGVFGPITWGPGKRSGSQECIIEAAVKFPGGGKWIPVSGFRGPSF
jgi:branched-chain amino acid transport system substrate-binding protein